MFTEIFGRESKKKQIFEILLSEDRLTARKLHNKLRKNFRDSTTYQSTFKTLQILVEDNIIIREGLNYRLNVEILTKFRDDLSKVIAYKVKNTGCVYSSDHIRIHILRSLKEVDNFIQENIIRLNKRLKLKETCWKTPHCWWLLGYPVEEEKYIEEYQAHKLMSYALITQNTYLDKSAEKYYLEKDRTYTKIRLINKPKDNEVVQVLGEYVFVFKIDQDIFKKLNQFYNKNKESIEISKILKIINQEGDFELQIVKNFQLARAYCKEIKGD